MFSLSEIPVGTRANKRPKGYGIYTVVVVEPMLLLKLGTPVANSQQPTIRASDHVTATFDQPVWLGRVGHRVSLASPSSINKRGFCMYAASARAQSERAATGSYRCNASRAE